MEGRVVCRGRFRLTDRKLGSGDYGHVYLGVEAQTGNMVRSVEHTRHTHTHTHNTHARPARARSDCDMRI